MALEAAHKLNNGSGIGIREAKRVFSRTEIEGKIGDSKKKFLNKTAANLLRDLMFLSWEQNKCCLASSNQEGRLKRFSFFKHF